MDDYMLKDNIETKLLFDIWVEDKGIIVEVDNGIITLSGTVPNYFGKIHAADVVKKVRGVKGVVNELQVNLSTHLKRNDKEITKAAIEALAWDIAIPQDAIKIVVEKGVVTLSGEVDSDSQRVRAYEDVRSLFGVEDVENNITLKPVPALDIKTIEKEIAREFQRNAALHSHKIKISIEGQKIYLSGSVSSWFEYKEATNAAFSVPGVKEVQNNLVIE
jgi:osmotically-inducible protein OsmY